MAFKCNLHMNAGEDETSYAQNSAFQKIVQDRMKAEIENAVTGLLAAATSTTLPKNIVMADLGCSSGPNALTLVSTALDAVYRQYRQHAQLPPELCVFLNDLPGNDFSTVAKSLATLTQRRSGDNEDFSSDDHPVMVVAGMIPGSFYERLFPSRSLHFVSSSNSLHWLSKAPEDLQKSRIPMYDIDENVRLSRGKIVEDAYARQFSKDFMLFLRLRAQEMVPGGRMVISLAARCSDRADSEFDQPWKPVMLALSNMALKGVISKEKLDSFYVPLHCPLDKEVSKIIQDEGSFEIDKMLMHDIVSAVDKAWFNAKMMTLGTRAAFEPIIVQHFGSSKEIMDEFMRTLEEHFSSGIVKAILAAEYPLVSLCFSLTKK